MTDSTSRLTIALSTSNAVSSADRLTTSLNRTTVAGDKASVSARATAASYRLAATAAAGYVGALSAGAVLSDLQRLQSINSRLGSLTGDLAGQQQFLKTTANELSAEYTALAGGYAKLLPLYDAGLLSLEQTRTITAGLANVTAEAGASSVQLGQTIFGLAQGLSAGVLRAEELNQVVEPMPGLLQALDRSAGLAAGGFRQLVVDGKVTSDFFRDTLIKALEEYDGAAAARRDNVEQTFNRTRNAYLEAVEAFNTPISAVAVTAANGVAEAFDVVSDNADEIVFGVQAVGVALAASFGASQIARIAQFSQAQGALTASIAASASADVRSAQAKAASTSASLAAAQATALSAKSRLDETRATLAHLPVARQEAFTAKEVAVAKKAAVIATAELAAAQSASTAAAANLTRANAAVTRSATLMAVAQRGATAAFSLIGGPTGAALIAAGGLLFLATRQTEAEKSADDLARAMDGLSEAFSGNADAASRAAQETINAQRANLVALEQQYDSLIALDEKLRSGGGVSARDLPIQSDDIATLARQIESAKNELEDFERSAQGFKISSALDDEFNAIQNILRKGKNDISFGANEIQDAYDKLFPNEAKITELESQLEKFRTALGDGAISAEYFNRVSAAVQKQIDDLSGLSESRKKAADVAEEYAKRVKDALDTALPDRARLQEQADQLSLLDAEYKKGGEDAELYAQAIRNLEQQFKLENIEAAEQKVRKFTEAISRSVDDPFESYRQDIALLNEALTELPDKASQIELALSNLDLSIQADLTVIESSGNRAVTEQAYRAQLEALQEFHRERNVSEDQAQQNIVDLARSYAEQLADIHDQEFAKLQSFRDQFGENSSQAGINLQVSFDGAQAEAAAIQDAQRRADALADIERTYQDRVSEIVRAGEATRSQIQESSFADRIAGVINANKTEIDATTNLVQSILSLTTNREKIEADQALSTARNLAQEAEDAKKVFEKTGLETDKILADQAKRRAEQAEATAKREFEQQKKAQLQQARLSQLLAIMNAYATGGSWLTGLAFAATAGIATQQVIDNIKAQEFNGGSSTISQPNASNANFSISANDQPAAQQQIGGPQERLVIVAGNFQTEDEALFEAGRQQQRLWKEGYINTAPDGSPDFGNVPDKVVRLTE